jgi:hypothetical protein
VRAKSLILDDGPQALMEGVVQNDDSAASWMLNIVDDGLGSEGAAAVMSDKASEAAAMEAD